MNRTELEQQALDISVEAAVNPLLLPLRTSLGDFYVGALAAGATTEQAVESATVAANMVSTGEASPSDSYLRIGALAYLSAGGKA